MAKRISAERAAELMEVPKFGAAERAQLDRDSQEVVDEIYSAKQKHEEHCVLWKLEKMDECALCEALEIAWSASEDFARDPFGGVS